MWELALSIAVGLGLSAACGFRVFVPMLVIAVASRAGHLELSHGFAWITTTPAIIAFGVATLIEIAGYYVPWLDHILDVAATPAAIVAGTIAMGSVVHDVTPFLQWTLAIVAGGGIAGAVQATTVLARATSTATTGGLANPLVSTIEAATAIASAVLAVVFPFLVIASMAAMVLAIWYVWRRRSVSRGVSLDDSRR